MLQRELRIINDLRPTMTTLILIDLLFSGIKKKTYLVVFAILETLAISTFSYKFFII